MIIVIEIIIILVQTKGGHPSLKDLIPWFFTTHFSESKVKSQFMFEDVVSFILESKFGSEKTKLELAYYTIFCFSL